MSVALLTLPMTWLYYAFVSPRKTGFFGGKIWWKKARFVHAGSILIFFIWAINETKNAYVALANDVVLAAIFWLLLRNRVYKKY